MKRHVVYFCLMMVVSVECGVTDCLGPFSMQGRLGFSLLFAAAWSSLLQGSYGATKQEVENHLEMGKKMLAAGQLSDALSHYHSAIDGDPTNYSSYFRRATVLLAMGKSRSALSDLDKVVELKPDFTAAWMQRGNIQLKQGAFDLAERDYKEVLKHDAAHAEAQKHLETLETLRADKLAAKQFIEAKDMNSAVDVLSRLLEACPWDSQLREMRSDAYMALGDPFKAAGDIKALSKLIPDNTDAMYRLSMIYYQMGQAVDSLTEIRECLKREEDHKLCKPHYKKVKKLVALQDGVQSAVTEHRWPDCLSKAASILELEQHIYSFRVYAMAQQCHCHSEVGDYKQTMEACNKVLEMDPNHYDALCDRANAYLKNDQFDEAINDYKQASSINGEFNRAKEGLDKAQKLKKQSEKRDYYKILGVKR